MPTSTSTLLHLSYKAGPNITGCFALMIVHGGRWVGCCSKNSTHFTCTRVNYRALLLVGAVLRLVQSHAWLQTRRPRVDHSATALGPLRYNPGITQWTTTIHITNIIDWLLSHMPLGDYRRDARRHNRFMYLFRRVCSLVYELRCSLVVVPSESRRTWLLTTDASVARSCTSWYRLNLPWSALAFRR